LRLIFYSCIEYYANNIIRRNKDATDWTLKSAEKANQSLQKLLRPHFLQRMKNTEFKDILPTKKELVVWTRLSERQRKLYANYLVDGGKVSAILSGAVSSPLEALTWLKKLCGHPCLVSQVNETHDRIKILEDSGKLQILEHLVGRLKQSGHRCLIFSQSTKMMDIIADVLNFKFGRIDGRTKGKDRQKIVDMFNKDDKTFDAMLLSTKAAGIGLTLTGADRAIIYDPSWNPADDSQAVDRCYRIGQKKDVTVYRFITAGTVEEKMYEKQVLKDGIRRTITTKSGCATERHFSDKDLSRLFELLPDNVCEMLDKIKERSKSGVVGSSGRRSILEQHHQVVGVSSHDMVYNATVVDISTPEQSPFAGTPADKKRHILVNLSHNSRRIDFGNEIIKTSGNKMYPMMDTACNMSTQEIRNIAKPLGRDKFDMAKLMPAPCNLKPSPAEGGSQDKENIKKRNGNHLDIFLEKVEKLTKEDKIVESLALLLEILETETLPPKIKLLVHQKIASRAILSLGWT